MATESVAGNEEMVDGVYPLGALISRSRGTSIYGTAFGEGAVPAVIKIREVESADVENLLQRMRDAARLTHPNLLRIYATGSSTLNDVPVIYAVMERAEESLGTVLAARALSNSETLEMLRPALEALDYLHKKGYAQARLRPSNVLAVGDQLKLSTDSVIQSQGAEEAEDMRELGILIVHALTQKTPREGWDAQDFEGIPQPLADIVRHCLDSDSAKRWTVDQVKARLDEPAVVAESAVRSEDSDAAGPKPGMPIWIYAGLAALILFVVLLAVSRRSHSRAEANPVVAVAQQAPAPVVAAPVETEAVRSPQVARAPRVEVPSASSRAGERKSAGWSVIVGAYGSREPAEKRMREMATRWPSFKISVVESQAEKTPYLVVLGRNLSEDQAQALRERAVDSGLARDTYIKRLM